MTMWRPTLENTELPLYQAIANSIANDVASGRLAEGARLPPQRDLADRLRVALTTVTRAYTEAERRGLVSGEVGRGTFVRRQESFHLHRREASPEVVDLTMNSLLPYPMLPALTKGMSRILIDAGASSLDYHSTHGSPAARRAASRLLEPLGLDPSPERILVTSGAQHAMAVVFSTLTNPGDIVLTGEVTYSGMKSLANFLHIRLRGLLMDEEGIRPDAFEAACATTEAKALYCMPTLQNPTSAVMSPRRRQEIVAIAEAYRMPVVEDDSYGFLLPETKALCSYAGRPDGFYYLTGTSKSLAPGLRIGFLLSPAEMVDRFAAAIAATTFMAPPPSAELVVSWLADGTADKVMEWKTREVRLRQKEARRLLGRFGYEAHPASPHGWLTLPEPWCVSDFVREARSRGVVVSAAEDFVAGRAASPHAVRLCLGPIAKRERLVEALEALAAILEQSPAPCRTVV